MIRLIVIFILLFSGIHSHGLNAQIQFTQKLDSTYMLIGDQQYLRLLSSDQQLGDRALEILDTLSWFHVIDKGSWQTTNQYVERRILFTVFDSGYFKIPSLGIIDSSNQLGNPLFLMVNYPADSLQVLRPIKGIEETSNQSRMMFFIILGVFLILSMLFVLWQFFKADRIKPAAIQIPDQKKIWEQCLLALTELESKHLWQDQKTKQYYDELNHILRNFLSSGLKVPALENTSTEIMEYIRKNNLLLEQRDQLESCFRESDLVKFANYLPGPERHIAWLSFSRHFIEHNRMLSEKILEENRIHYIALLGEDLGNQFDNPLDTVPDDLIRLFNAEGKTGQIELLHQLVDKFYFELPEDWVKWHEMHTGSFYRWHTSILGISKNKIVQLVIILFVLPFIALFLPFIWIVSLWKKQNLFSRGIFGITKNKKLILRPTT